MEAPISQRVALITNDPAPYRVPIFNRIAQMPGVVFQVIFCCAREPNRLWDVPPMEFDHIFLRRNFITLHGRFIHNNLDVISSLKKFAPDLIITDGFNPTPLYAFGYAVAKGLAHVAMTDGTVQSEQTLSGLHRIVRRFVYARTHAFVAASSGGKKLYESYGIAEERCFRSCLCIDNAVFSPAAQQEQKQFDLIFSGRIEPVKNPLFALEVAIATAQKLGRKIRILFVGTGSQEQNVRQAAAQQAGWVEAVFHGFASQKDLPALYRSARIFIFPTHWDPWGVVANEACAAGLPVLVSPHAGVADELVLDGENGCVCNLEVALWAERTALLLTQPEMYRKFSDRSRSLVNAYTFDNAASGLVTACHFAAAALGKKHPKFG